MFGRLAWLVLPLALQIAAPALAQEDPELGDTGGDKAPPEGQKPASAAPNTWGVEGEAAAASGGFESSGSGSRSPARTRRCSSASRCASMPSVRAPSITSCAIPNGCAEVLRSFAATSRSWMTRSTPS